MIKQLNRNSKIIWLALKVAISVTILFLLWKIFHDKWETMQMPLRKIDGQFSLMIIFVILLMPLNWFFEAVKWKLILKPIQAVSLYHAFKEVLIGVSLNFLIPFSAGDLISRSVQRSSVKSALKANAASRLYATIPTLLFGCISVIFWFGMNTSLFFINSILILLIFVGSLWYFKITHFALPLLMAIFRYLVFVAQYFITFSYFLPELAPIYILLGSFWVLFFRTLIPSFFGAFGVRELSAFLFFQSYLSHPEMAVFAATIIWMVNILFPAIIGVILLFRQKLDVHQFLRKYANTPKATAN